MALDLPTHPRPTTSARPILALQPAAFLAERRRTEAALLATLIAHTAPLNFGAFVPTYKEHLAIACRVLEPYLRHLTTLPDLHYARKRADMLSAAMLNTFLHTPESGTLVPL